MTIKALQYCINTRAKLKGSVRAWAYTNPATTHELLRQVVFCPAARKPLTAQIDVFGT